MNKQQANRLINIIKNECKSHRRSCTGCPFEYIDEEGFERCFINDGFIPYQYDNELLGE